MRNQEFFGAEQVSWNRGTSINTSCKIYKRRAFKNYNKNLTHRCTQTGHTKRALFVYFHKKDLPPARYALILIYFL